MESVNYLLSLVEGNTIRIDDDFKFRIAITIVQNDIQLLIAFQEGLSNARL